MIISLDTEKAHGKTQHRLKIKVHGRPGIQGTNLKIMKEIYRKPTANININRKKFKAFQLKSAKKTRLSNLSIHIQYST